MATESDSHDDHHDHHVPESWWLPIMGLSAIFAGLAIFLIGKSLVPGVGDEIGAFLGFGSLLIFFALFAGAILSEISKNKFSIIKSF